jgi:predicted naringenin-chalcone synthase
MQNGLALQEEDCKYSRQVLNEYGNMSSPSVMFVLDLITKSVNKAIGTKTIMNAFGPGLTLETAYLEYE